MNGKELLREAMELQEEVVKCRHYLHENAETGFELTKTVAYVKEKLSEMGINVVPCGKNGLTAVIGNGEGKTILLRADMDALPGEEKADLPFACKKGNMHACGHDMHTAMLLGAARLLKNHEREINGKVKLMFQPAEEILAGSKNMLENGVLENPCVDAALMIHVMAGLPLEKGTVIVAKGISAPAADYFTINIHGKSCHGSTPHQGIDALTIGAHTLIALQEISAREIGVSEEAVLTIGKMKGGKAGNVIADSVTMEGTLRAYDEEVRTRIKKRISEITKGVADTFRGKGSADFGNGCPTLLNDDDLSVKVEACLKEFLGRSVLNTEKMGGRTSKSGGSEDFAYVSHKVPSVMLALAAGNEEEGYEYPQHHPKVVFDEKVLPIGCAVYAFLGLKLLEN